MKKAINEKQKINQDRFRYNNPGKGKNQKGENNPNFKETNYTSLHQSLNTWYGKTTKCEICGKLRDNSKRRDIDWVNITGNYNLERNNWKQLCVKCHNKLDRTCILIYSGGLDSTTLLYWLKKQQKITVYALSFDYGQRHRKELEKASETCKVLGINHKVINISSINEFIQGSALTSKDIEVPTGHYESENMKLTVVPNRNAIMLSIAVGYAVSIGAGKVYTAVHAGDHFIYPDCRPEFIKAINEYTLIANFVPVKVEAPFLNIDKGDIVKIGRMLNVDYSKSYTCYSGQEKSCGKCGSCVERILAMDKAGIKDTIEYVLPWEEVLKNAKELIRI